MFGSFFFFQKTE